jgi:tRNA-splicing ligase RtcB (3'-phosphate/5'-hydroxy nucleic acid ligase)
MAPKEVAPKLLSWASELDDQTLAQARRTARLPIIEGHVALMPDAHLGIGATVGSVIPTQDAIIPAAVGVDIGCGVIAVETDVRAEQLPDNLNPLLRQIERRIPAGVGHGHDTRTDAAANWFRDHHPKRWRREPFTPAQEKRAIEQFGTLGAGNHYLEVCLDERDVVWTELHSGSRGIGNQLATMHIDRARKSARMEGLELEDRDLAYFREGTTEFHDYVADMLWAQDYALANREQMMDVLLQLLFTTVGSGAEIKRINCHHNYSARERHGEHELWITRKGAIRARAGDEGVIPGSMATGTYIVRGRGEPASYESSAHGAGRRHSRRQAKKRFTVEQLQQHMAGKAWNRDRARALLDEIPDAYKDVESVMEDQRDLVEVEHVLHQVLNYKGS